MIKNIAYFPLQVAINGAPIMSAALDCLQAAGIQTQENSMTSDAAIIWSVLWHGRMQPNQAVYNHYRAQNKPVIVIEIGALYRGDTWKIAVNHINSQGYYGHLHSLDWDRPRKLKISLASQTSSRPEIIIAAQHQRSLLAETITPMAAWIETQIKLLRENTDRPIVVRPHPRSNIQLNNLPPRVTLQHPNKLTGTYDSFDMHYNCHAVVNYNSGPGIQAAIAGVRPIVDTSSLAQPVGIKHTDVEQSYVVDRDLWLAQICHTEYTVDEIKKGIWLRRIQSALTV
jgi:hypothetical protein